MGEEMREIPLAKPFFGEEEVDAVRKTFKSGWVAGDGPNCKALEEKITRRVRVKHAIVVGNCTEALHLALLANGVKKGDEVIVSDYTYPATAHAVMYCGATPRFADVDVATYNVSPHSVSKLVNSRTKGIIPVHTFGQSARMDEIVEIADSNDLFIVEDAACAIGATFKGTPVGSIGDVGCFSMHARKNATTGEGGFITTNDDSLAEKMRELHYFGIKPAYNRSELPQFTSMGYNYKMSDIAAAIGSVQLDRLDSLIAKRRALADKYSMAIKRIPGISIPYSSSVCKHIYQSYVCMLDSNVDRQKLMDDLKAVGIGTQIGTYACHMQPVYNSKDKCFVSKALFERSIALPMYYEMEPADVDFVAKSLKRLLS